eukprot:GHVQ01004183.1.p1 GENE.GHVQ01004183.1~~GHVQ01004183.1.p1  ORF type:complete len:660 (-),score=70.11 GHVQ01004183.1:290-2269(-)
MPSPTPTPAASPSFKEKSESFSVSVCLEQFGRKLNPFVASDHPAQFQLTPLGLNRYILLTAYTILSLLCGAIYFNWASIARMLFRNGAFQEVCEIDINGNYVDDKRLTSQDIHYVCDAQDAAVQRLFSICLASNFCASAVAGTLLDRFGMKKTASLGVCLHIVAWLLLTFSSVSFNGYYAAFILLGAACDTAFLPSLVIGNLFPGNSALVITILGSAASLSFAVPLVMRLALDSNPSWTFQYVCVGYLLFALLPCLIMVVFLMPWKNFIGIDKFGQSLDSAIDQSGSTHSEEEKEQTQDNQSARGMEDIDLGDTRWERKQSGSGIPRRRSSAAWKEQEGREESEKREDALRSASTTELSAPFSETPGPSHLMASPSTLRDLSPIGDKMGRGGVPSRSPTVCEFRASMRSQFLTPHYLCIVIYFMVTCTAVNFYYQATDSRLYTSEKVRHAHEILNPLSFIPCIIGGKLIGVFGLFAVLYAINTSGLLSLLFPIIRTDATGYISALMFSLYMSLYTSQMFCYVESSFDSLHFGKLVGVCSLLGGLICLIPIYETLTVNVSDGNPAPVLWGLSVLIVGMFGVITVMLYLERRYPTPAQKACEKKKGNTFKQHRGVSQMVGDSVLVAVVGGDSIEMGDRVEGREQEGEGLGQRSSHIDEGRG